MELKSMKMDKKEIKEKCEPCIAVDGQPEYPWGLNLRLDEDSIKKLGIKEMPAADDVMILIAKVHVDESGSIDTSDGGKRRNLSLQITDMAINPEKAKKDTAMELYQ